MTAIRPAVLTSASSESNDPDARPASGVAIDDAVVSGASELRGTESGTANSSASGSRAADPDTSSPGAAKLDAGNIRRAVTARSSAGVANVTDRLRSSERLQSIKRRAERSGPQAFLDAQAAKRRMPGWLERLGRWQLVTFAVVVVVLLTASMVGTLIMNTMAASASFKRYELNNKNAALAVQQQALEKQIEDKSNPVALAAAAAQRGMVPATNPAFIDATTGQVLGAPEDSANQAQDQAQNQALSPLAGGLINTTDGTGPRVSGGPAASAGDGVLIKPGQVPVVAEPGGENPRGFVEWQATP